MASLEPWCADQASCGSVEASGGAAVVPLTAAAHQLRMNAPAALAPPPTPSAPSACGFGRGSFGQRRFGSGSRFGHGGGGEPAPSMSLVAPGLYIGDEAAAANASALLAAGVTHVLNCSNLPDALAGHPSRPPHYQQLFLLDSLADMPRIQEAFAVGSSFIAQGIGGGGSVLVHCHKGISRSATLAIAFLVRHTHTPAERVLEQLRAKRRVIDPNLGYLMSLKEWEQKVLPPEVLANAQSPAARSFARSPALHRGDSSSTHSPLPR